MQSTGIKEKFVTALETIDDTEFPHAGNNNILTMESTTALDDGSTNNSDDNKCSNFAELLSNAT